jgi:hypothetical protein
MARRNGDGPSEATVRFWKRVAMIVCFGFGFYFLVVSTSMLRKAGARADNARQYAGSHTCPAQHGYGSLVVLSECRLLVPTTVVGSHQIGGFTFYRLKPSTLPAVDFHEPSNPGLVRELQARSPLFLEYWRGKVSALRDGKGHAEPAYGAPNSSSQTNAVGASGVLFFALLLFAAGIAAARLPVSLAVGGGPGRYSLPFSTRPAQRWMYAVFAAPALAWLIPSVVQAKAEPSLTLSKVVDELAGGLAFAGIVGALCVLFAAWYLENRIELSLEGITNRTLFTSRKVRFEDVAGWTVRNRRRSRKVQFVDIYTRDEKKPVRLQLDMQWRRSKAIVQDVLRRRAPVRSDEERSAGVG